MQIVFGVDYTVGEAELQHARLREAISGHVIKYPSSLVVVEEFDKVP